MKAEWGKEKGRKMGGTPKVKRSRCLKSKKGESKNEMKKGKK